MLLATLSELYQWGGFPFMDILTLLFLTNICIFIYILIVLIQKKQFNTKWLESIKQIGGLSAVFGALSTLFGLFGAFNALEAEGDTISFQAIMGGLKAGLIGPLYGLIIFCLSLLSYIILKLMSPYAKT